MKKINNNKTSRKLLLFATYYDKECYKITHRGEKIKRHKAVIITDTSALSKLSGLVKFKNKEIMLLEKYFPSYLDEKFTNKIVCFICYLNNKRCVDVYYHDNFDVACELLSEFLIICRKDIL